MLIPAGQYTDCPGCGGRYFHTVVLMPGDSLRCMGCNRSFMASNDSKGPRDWAEWTTGVGPTWPVHRRPKRWRQRRQQRPRF